MNKYRLYKWAVLSAIIGVPLIIVFFLGFAAGRHSAARHAEKEMQALLEAEAESAAAAADTPEEIDEVSPEYVYYHKAMPSLSRNFADLPESHMEAAERYGLKTIPLTRTDITADRLVRIDSCALYNVDRLTHSIPYLTRGAATELEAIATNFRDILKEHNLPLYKIVVTSVLRTQEDAKRLQRSGNVNASTNSAHCYATTFDISYVHFDKADDDKRVMDNYELKKVLAEALLKEKEAGHIYVKYERKQPCFHTTARR